MKTEGVRVCRVKMVSFIRAKIYARGHQLNYHGILVFCPRHLESYPKADLSTLKKIL